jgi:hypothetical protein
VVHPRATPLLIPAEAAGLEFRGRGAARRQPRAVHPFAKPAKPVEANGNVAPVCFRTNGPGNLCSNHNANPRRIRTSHDQSSKLSWLSEKLPIDDPRSRKPRTDMAQMPTMRMGRRPELAADEHDRIMVRIGLDLPHTDPMQVEATNSGKRGRPPLSRVRDQWITPQLPSAQNGPALGQTGPFSLSR